ncbi:glutaredoxin, putative [Acanthamoeba castellanii str. Neff]|uniref:Glutaredoxin, putative n=1 Tax=Acanthamoeba castellanii (strain ATCC 30010 / Neff) TaxID=1257118 RepID=L8GD26_ACACF|nr:glutaredoxin, putative [Acanthamoeba castellanii str. Neff]ELR11055.1 glutaredoxin, putative [Acanthamoeba castellanii str. Neff]
MATVIHATEVAQVAAAVSSCAGVLHFWAEWCGPAKQMSAIFAELARANPTITFVEVEAEKLPEVAERYDVKAVPYFVFLLGGKVKESVEGANPPEVVRAVRELAAAAASGSTATAVKAASAPQAAATSAAAASPEDVQARLTKLTSFAPVMLFMKGTPEAPKCGFSRKIVEILNQEHVRFGSFDILSDNEVREGLKKLSNWPTYPQLYVNGKLIGGLDIVKELHEEGEFPSVFPKQEDDLNTRLQKLISQAPVVLFMKGSPDAPRCGFSNKTVALLQGAGIKFAHFDILSDSEVREGLKKYSNWPTYPQLYVSGKLVGGLDIIKEMHEEGELLAVIPPEAK